MEKKIKIEIKKAAFVRSSPKLAITKIADRKQIPSSTNARKEGKMPPP